MIDDVGEFVVELDFEINVDIVILDEIDFEILDDGLDELVPLVLCEILDDGVLVLVCVLD